MIILTFYVVLTWVLLLAFYLVEWVGEIHLYLPFVLIKIFLLKVNEPKNIRYNSLLGYLAFCYPSPFTVTGPFHCWGSYYKMNYCVLFRSEVNRWFYLCIPEFPVVCSASERLWISLNLTLFWLSSSESSLLLYCAKKRHSVLLLFELRAFIYMYVAHFCISIRTKQN